MTTERNAQGVDGLAEVMGLLGKATPGEWVTWGEPTHDDPSVKIVAGDAFIATTLARNDHSNAAAIIAAVNYLRSHGEAIRELAAAASEICDQTERWNLAVVAVIGRQPNNGLGTERLRAALAKFPEPRP
jgi:hypothetical protein